MKSALDGIRSACPFAARARGATLWAASCRPGRVSSSWTAVLPCAPPTRPVQDRLEAARRRWSTPGCSTRDRIACLRARRGPPEVGAVIRVQRRPRGRVASAPAEPDDPLDRRARGVAGIVGGDDRDRRLDGLAGKLPRHRRRDEDVDGSVLARSSRRQSRRQIDDLSTPLAALLQRGGSPRRYLQGADLRGSWTPRASPSRAVHGDRQRRADATPTGTVSPTSTEHTGGRRRRTWPSRCLRFACLARPSSLKSR